MAEIRYAVYRNLHPGYSGRGHSRVLRLGGATTEEARRTGAPSQPMGPHDVQLVQPSENWLAAMVYKVQLSTDLLKRWNCQPESFLVVATSPGAVKSYLEKRFSKIAVRQMGLAVSACERVMEKMSTRPPKSTRVGRKARSTSARETFVLERVNGDVYSLDIRDNISYAQLAVRGGKGAIDLALKRAANKVAGLIQHKCKRFMFEGEVETPFPEVRRRRSR